MNSGSFLCVCEFPNAIFILSFYKKNIYQSCVDITVTFITTQRFDTWEVVVSWIMEVEIRNKVVVQQWVLLKSVVVDWKLDQHHAMIVWDGKLRWKGVY